MKISSTNLNMHSVVEFYNDFYRMDSLVKTEPRPIVTHSGSDVIVNCDSMPQEGSPKPRLNLRNKDGSDVYVNTIRLNSRPSADSSIQHLLGDNIGKTNDKYYESINPDPSEEPDLSNWSHECNVTIGIRNIVPTFPDMSLGKDEMALMSFSDGVSMSGIYGLSITKENKLRILDSNEERRDIYEYELGDTKTEDIKEISINFGTIMLDPAYKAKPLFFEVFVNGVMLDGGLTEKKSNFFLLNDSEFIGMELRSAGNMIAVSRGRFDFLYYHCSAKSFQEEEIKSRYLYSQWRHTFPLTMDPGSYLANNRIGAEVRYGRFVNSAPDTLKMILLDKYYQGIQDSIIRVNCSIDPRDTTNPKGNKVISLIPMTNNKNQGFILNVQEKDGELYFTDNLVPNSTGKPLLKVSDTKIIDFVYNGNKLIVVYNEQYNTSEFTLTSEVNTVNGVEYGRIEDVGFEISSIQLVTRIPGETQSAVYKRMFEFTNNTARFNNVEEDIGRISQDGLVLWLDAKEQQRLIKSGHNKNVWKDISGNGNDGELIGFETLSNFGWTDEGLRFDGTQTYIETKYIAKLNEGFTVSVSGDFSKLTKDSGGILRKLVISPYEFGFYKRDANTFRFVIWADTGSAVSQLIIPSEYIHSAANLSFTNTMKSLNFYADGVLMQTQNISMDNWDTHTGTDRTLEIGVSGPSGQQRHGLFLLSSLQWYNRVLTEEEIKQNYKTTKLRYGKEG